MRGVRPECMARVFFPSVLMNHDSCRIVFCCCWFAGLHHIYGNSKTVSIYINQQAKCSNTASWKVASPPSHRLLYFKSKSVYTSLGKHSLESEHICYAIYAKFNTSNGSHRNSQAFIHVVMHNEHDCGGKIKMQGAFSTFDDAKQKITHKLLP